jgi:uncharacterized protein (DUF2267 family)
MPGGIVKFSSSRYEMLLDGNNQDGWVLEGCDMTAEEFVRKVRDRAGLEDDEQARQATDAVFGALRARISHAGGDNVANQLPKEIRDLWESGLIEHAARGLVGIDRMNLKEFLARVQNKAHVASVDEAEVVTRSVFETLREQITPGARQAVGHQLPEDILELWRTSATPEEVAAQPQGPYGSEEIGPSAVSLQKSDTQLAADVEDLLEASDELEAERIDVHVQSGTVTLRGVVRSSHEWERAERIAAETLGVVSVRNELTVVEEA